MNWQEFVAEYESSLNTTIGMCSANLLKVNNQYEKNHRMTIIKIENGTQADLIISKVLNTQVIQREPNYMLFTYK